MKRISILLSMLVGVLMLFAYSEAMAAGDCSPIDPNTGFSTHTCWDFGLGYKIEVYPTQFGVIDPSNGKILYTYQVTKAKNASANFLGLGVDSFVKVLQPPSDYTTLFPPCVGDVTTSVGVGDCYRQWLKWSPSQNTLSYLHLYVEQKGTVARMPVAMKGGTGYTVEMGAVVGPSPGPPPVADTTKILTYDNIKLELTLDQYTGDLVSACVIQPDGTCSQDEVFLTDLTQNSLTVCLGGTDNCTPTPLSLQWASNDCRLRHGNHTCTSTTTYVLGKPYLITTCTCPSGLQSDCPAGYTRCVTGVCKK